MRKNAPFERERLRDHLSEVSESFDYLRSDVRNLSRYMAELEELVEVYRAFTANAHLSTQADLAARRKLLQKTEKIVGPPPERPEGVQNLDASTIADKALISHQVAREL